MILSPGDSRHAATVLRLKKGQRVRAGDGRGTVLRGTIVSVSPAAVRIGLDGPVFAAESSLDLTLLQALVKGEKLDLIVRQATELGVKRIIPVYSARSIPRWDKRKELRRLARLQAIARGAAAQCQRALVPVVEPVHTFARVLKTVSNGCMLVSWEAERTLFLADLLRQTAPNATVSIFIGPEGGFTPDEVLALDAAGATLVHLGSRLLRSETAAAVACALLQAAWGDLENGKEK